MRDWAVQNTFSPLFWNSPEQPIEAGASPEEGRGRLLAIRSAALLITTLLAAQLSSAQVSVTTYHNDNARTGQNTAETVLTPANVNATQFGKLFSGSVNLDSWSTAQPLYVPNVTVGGKKHNVVYIATINNSLYAFDADTAVLLWTNNYGPPTPYASLCQDSGYGKSPSLGAGIVSTPAIDAVAGIIYFVTKTGDGTSSPYALYLHAVDFTTGFDEIGSPVLVSPTSGPSFMPEYQMNRPALLLNNGMVYIALGSTGCLGLKSFPRINNHGWVFAFNTASLSTPPFSFVTTPDVDNGGIWQSGGGVAADSDGNIYFETADANFDKDSGGEDLGDSVVKLDHDLDFGDYFTPYNQGTLLNPQDLDLGSTGPLLLPDQPFPPTHLMIATGKAEEIYLINRDSMGAYCANCSSNSNILQDVPPPSSLTGCLPVNKLITCYYGPPSYWNNNIYFPSVTSPMTAYTLTNNGAAVTLGSLPSSQTISFPGIGPASISSNGTNSGITWTITWNGGNETIATGTLRAFDATNLATEFYDSDAAAQKRDSLGKIARYVTPTIANGKVYTATQTQLVVYGLLFPLSATAGNNQSGTVNTALSLPLTVQAINPYTGKPAPGVHLTFTSNSGGTFGTPSPITDKNGNASSTYTLPTKAGSIVVTISGSTAVSAVFNVTANAGPVSRISLVSGGAQSGTVATALPQPVVISTKDSFGNVISGLSVALSDGGVGGTFSANPIVSGSNGQASVNYTLPTKATGITINATASSIRLPISERSVAGPPATVSYVSGNHQSAPPNTALANPLMVSVKDQFSNLIAGATVTFSDNGAGGTFSSSGVVTTGSTGRASITYTTGPQTGTVSITATISGLAPVSFVETVN